MHGMPMSAVTPALSLQQGSQLSKESGSEEDAPPIRRWLEAQAAGSEDTDGEEPGTAAPATHSAAEALHNSAAPSSTLVEQEVRQRSHMALSPALISTIHHNIAIKSSPWDGRPIHEASLKS